jgi:AcrR family transcriptional regulator
MTERNYHHGDLKNALIQAGIEILADEGVGGLSLRKVARQAGVSHAAPYAHYADKQTLIAAIAADGHVKINTRLEMVMSTHPDDPLRQLLGAVWAYVEFGLDAPDHYKITFSGSVQDEHGFPEFVEISKHNMQLLNTIVDRCRAAKVLDSQGMDTEMQAFCLWGLIHGLVTLIIQHQIPSHLLQRMEIADIVTAALSQVVRVPISKEMLV